MITLIKLFKKQKEYDYHFNHLIGVFPTTETMIRFLYKMYEPKKLKIKAKEKYTCIKVCKDEYLILGGTLEEITVNIQNEIMNGEYTK